MIEVNGRRRIKPDKGILDFFKKINDVKGIVNGFTILLVLSIMMKNYVASSKKTLKIGQSQRELSQIKTFRSVLMCNKLELIYSS